MTSSTLVDRSPVPQGCAFEVGQLLELLAAGEPGDILTDEEMGRLIHMKIKPGDRDSVGFRRLRTALRRSRQVRGIVWKRLFGEGRIQCLGPVESLDEADRRKVAARRQLNVASEIHGTVVPEDVPEEQRSRYLAQGMVLHAGRTLLRAPAQKAIESKVDEADEPSHQRIVDIFLRRNRLK